LGGPQSSFKALRKNTTLAEGDWVLLSGNKPAPPSPGFGIPASPSSNRSKEESKKPHKAAVFFSKVSKAIGLKSSRH